jgi:hypothetical protein
VPLSLEASSCRHNGLIAFILQFFYHAIHIPIFSWL